MSPNLVLQQLISDQNSTLPPNMPISTCEASMVNCQWSMVNTFFNTLYKWICTTNILSPQFTAMQQVALNSFPPNSAPSETAFHRSNPANLLRSSLCISIIRIPFAGGLVVWNGGGIVLESVQSRKKESGLSNWAAGGRKSQHSANASGWWWRFLRLRYCSILFPCKNRFVIAFLGM